MIIFVINQDNSIFCMFWLSTRITQLGEWLFTRTAQRENCCLSELPNWKNGYLPEWGNGYLPELLNWRNDFLPEMPNWENSEK